MKNEMPNAKTHIKFNPKKTTPEQVDRARAVIVNAIVSRGIVDGVGKKSIEVKSFFKEVLAKANLEHEMGAAKVTNQEVTSREKEKDTQYEVIKEEGKQVWTIRVYDKDKNPLYEITVDYNPELVRETGMHM